MSRIGLHIDKQQTIISFNNESISLPIGYESIMGKRLQYTPASAFEVEHAIMVVEDNIMPVYAKLPKNSELYTKDWQILTIAKLVGLQAQSTMQLTIENVEDLFNRLADIINGKPATLDTIPITHEFTLTLLILREILHHWQYSQITIEC